MDISTLTADLLAQLQTNLWLLSPSCQPYTVLNPQARGAADPRAQSFLHLVGTVLPDLVLKNSHPAYILVENVAGFEVLEGSFVRINISLSWILPYKTSGTRQTLLSTLTSLGYAVFEFLLTPLQFGIPNSRLRYYLLAKMTPLIFPVSQSANEGKIWRHIPGRGQAWLDTRLHNGLQPSNAAEEIRHYLDADSGDATQVSDEILKKWGRLFDIVLPSSRRTCCFTRGATLFEHILVTKLTICHRLHPVGRKVRLNLANEWRTRRVFPESSPSWGNLTGPVLQTAAIFEKFYDAQVEGDENAVCILHPLRLRYFSPTELLRLFNFDSRGRDEPLWNSENGFVWPSSVSTKAKYRLIGNSVNVQVVTALIDFLFE